MSAPAVAASPEPPASTSDIVHATNLSTCVLVVLVLAWSLGGHQLAQRSKYMTEGSAACALGLITGITLLIGHRFLDWDIVTQLLEFNAAGFFTYLLPPVIFYCGLSVEKSRFFLALPSILMYGVFGTLTSFIIISVFMYLTLGFAMFKIEDCLAMGAIFAATDSVATLQVLDKDAMPNLFALVFGEGVVNDAVSVVLLGAVAAATHAHDSGGEAAGSQHRLAGGIVANFVWLLVTSLLLGGAAGLGIAVLLRRLRLQGAHQEMAVIALLSYLSYLLADVLGLSAILSLFVCGVVVSHYALHNVSPEGRHATMAGFKTASYLAEGIIFIYVGMDALDPLKWQGANAVEALWLVVVLTVLLVVARAVFVIPFSLLHNCWSAPADRLSRRDVVIVWWAGLMRGAVSVALVYYYFDDNPRQMLDKGRATLIVTTLMVVMLSILGFGACTKPLLAAMLKGDAEAAALAVRLSKIPLLGNLTRDASAASLHMFGDSFSRPGSGSGPQHHHTRHNSTASSRDGGSPDHDAAPAEPLQHSGTSINMYTSAGTGPPGACGVYNSRSGSGRGGRGWGLGLGALTRPGGGSNKASDSGDAAIGMYQLGAAGTGGGGAQPPQQQQDAFAGFDVSEENQGVFVLDGGSDDRAQQQQQQQQQQWRGQQRPHQPPAGAAVELQQQQQQQQGAVPGGSSSMLAAMRHVGHVWGEFDRTVMQPVFGGPSTPRASDPGGGDGSSNQGQAPSNPSNQPL